MREDKKSCSDCRYRITGWDGGFDGEPMTCECKIYGTIEDRKDCKRFKRPFPKGFELLVEFREWFNSQGYSAICIDTPFEIDYDDLLRFRSEWK